jgi:hypothetical protein
MHVQMNIALVSFSCLQHCHNIDQDSHVTEGVVIAGVVPQAFFTPRPEAGTRCDTPADRVAEAVMSRSEAGLPRRFTIKEEARTPLGRAWQGYLRCGLRPSPTLETTFGGSAQTGDSRQI